MEEGITWFTALPPGLLGYSLLDTLFALVQKLSFDIPMRVPQNGLQHHIKETSSILLAPPPARQNLTGAVAEGVLGDLHDHVQRGAERGVRRTALFPF